MHVCESYQYPYKVALMFATLEVVMEELLPTQDSGLMILIFLLKHDNQHQL